MNIFHTTTQAVIHVYTVLQVSSLYILADIQTVSSSYFHTTLRRQIWLKRRHFAGGEYNVQSNFTVVAMNSAVVKIVCHSAATFSAFMNLPPDAYYRLHLLADIELAHYSLTDHSSFLQTTSQAVLHRFTLTPGLSFIFVYTEGLYLCPCLPESLSSRCIYSHLSNLQIIIGEWKGVYKLKCTSDLL